MSKTVNPNSVFHSDSTSYRVSALGALSFEYKKKEVMAVVDRFIGKSIEKGMSFVWKNFIEKLEFGLYPKEYNRNVHGPYVPSRYYGKVDTRFTNVKIGELIPWIRRRKMGPVAFAQLLSRGYHRWCEHYVHVRYGSAAYLFQLSAVVMIYFYFVRLPYIWYHKSYRYHW